MNRPGAAVTAAGALLALLYQGTATAHGGGGTPREVSGGFASWGPSFGASTGSDGVTVTAGAPAARGSGGRTWFPVDAGSATPGAGDVDIALDGSIRLGGAGTDTLTLDRLRLRLDGGTGTLRVRAERAGESGDLTLAAIDTGATVPNVRSGGATWSGLRVSLTAEGAALLTRWSGLPYAADDELAPLDVTVGTGASAPTAPQDGPPGQSDGDSSSSPPGRTDTPNGSADAGTDVDMGGGTGAGREAGETPSVAVERASLAAGDGQRVTGEGFAPGEVVLVAIDDDTRYQAVADASGRVARDFPVYDTATEGAHTVRLYSVTGGREAVAEFTVRVGGATS